MIKSQYTLLEFPLSQVRDLGQSGWQRRGRRQIKNEFIFLLNGKLNNLSSGFLFSDHANFGDFTLLFCIGQLKMNTVLNARAELLF